MTTSRYRATGEQRLIDQLPEKRNPKGMRILILGMPRTGIVSLHTALARVGYKPFHGQMMDEMPELYPLWEEALGAKYYGEGEPFGVREYNKILGDFDVCSNFPGILVAEDLIKAYPEAKVILTTRDVDAWLRPMRNWVDPAHKWKSLDWLAPWEPTVIGPWWKYYCFQRRLRQQLTLEGERQAFLNHYALVRNMVPPERLLDFNVSEGWDPLCDFLDIAKPDFDFPHVSNTDQFLAARAQRWRRAFNAMLSSVALWGFFGGSMCALAYFIMSSLASMTGL